MPPKPKPPKRTKQQNRETYFNRILDTKLKGENKERFNKFIKGIKKTDAKAEWNTPRKLKDMNKLYFELLHVVVNLRCLCLFVAKHSQKQLCI